MKNEKMQFMTHAAAIAALYVVLTLVANALGLANYAIQVRFSEALTILPYFTSAAIPGLFIGCLSANLIMGAGVLDIVFGSVATFLGAIGTYLLRKKSKYFAPIPPIVANMLIVPCVLIWAGASGAWWYFALTVGAGELVSCGIFGIILYNAIEKKIDKIF